VKFHPQYAFAYVFITMHSAFAAVIQYKVELQIWHGAPIHGLHRAYCAITAIHP
jgi:hypothetical protein